MLGKPVVGTDAVIVGTVKDLAVSNDGRVALQVERRDASNQPSSEMYLGSEEISAVADVILLKHSSGRAGSGATAQGQPQTPTSLPSNSGTYTAPPPYPGGMSVGKACSKCGYVNNASSRFCIKCGSSLS